MTKRRLLLVPGILGRPSEVFIYRHAAGLTSYDCHVAASQYRNRDAYPHPQVHLLDAQAAIPRLALRLRYAARYQRKPTRAAVRSWQLAELACRLKVELIHVHFLWNARLALEGVAATGVPLLVTAHGTDVNSALVDTKYRESLRPVFDRADRILAVSDFIAARLAQIGCDEAKIQRHYLGAPIPESKVRPTADENGDGEIRVVCVAAFRAVKGHQHLVRAFALASRDDKRLRLMLIGDGPERQPIASLVHELKIADRVTFQGSVGPKQVEQTLGQSHIYAQHSLPSHETDESGSPRLSEEALGISFVEAAGHGLPLVAARSGGVPEICRDEVNGFLVDPEDVGHMAQRITELAREPQLRARLGQAGRELVLEHFNQELQLARLEAYYDSILDGKPATTPLASVLQ